jgi:hypothetical protein
LIAHRKQSAAATHLNARDIITLAKKQLQRRPEG